LPASDIYRDLGERIKEMRESRGLSQEALAKALGIAANTISRWETATYKPTLDELERLARHFKVSMLSLLPVEKRPEPEKMRSLLRAAQHLKDEDVARVTEFAEYIATKNALRGARPAKRKKAH
jgi:transcriptional regulator with XRE-family HTH domain